MRYLIAFVAAALIGCAASQPPRASQAKPDHQAGRAFVGHWNNADPSTKTQPLSLDVHADGTFAGVGHDGAHFTGKWTSASKTSASFTEDDDPEVVLGLLTGKDELTLLVAGEAPIKFKRQP